MSEYPIQAAKVQPPPLREDTLARDRLLDWLKVRIHRRVVLVIAEAGYGKTTLLADFSRRTRVRTVWYRLDRGDRDWVPFLAHIVAGFRSHLPGFAPATDGLIRETGTSSPPLRMVLGTLLREMASLPAEPAALILDDYHLVEDSPDIVHIVREMLARAPERLTLVLISRQLPLLPLARLRALAEVAELGTDDLRFDQAETAKLFRETFAIKLEDAVLAELSSKTEGWAASLELVRAAIRDRTPTQRRAFIHSISGAEGALYDYLAEEVVGDQSPELQRFLMRTAVLESIDPELASVAADIEPDAARASIEAGEALGLFGRRGAGGRHYARAHPLVREFLLTRLKASLGPDGIRAINRAVARVAEHRDWQLAAHHYREADDFVDARRVLAEALETILATGADAVAEDLARSLPDPDPDDPTQLVIASRLQLQRGDTADALQTAERAALVAPNSEIALWNRLMIRVSASELATLDDEVVELERRGAPPIRLRAARAAAAAVAASVDGSLGEAGTLLEECVTEARRRDYPHFLGVALLNLAQVRRVQGMASDALLAAEEAIDVLEPIAGGIELTSAKLAKAWALAHLGQVSESRATYQDALRDAARHLEAAFEAADIEVLYGDAALAIALLEPHKHLLDHADDVGEQALLSYAAARLRSRDTAFAEGVTAVLRYGSRSTGTGFDVRRRVFKAQLALAIDNPNWRSDCETAIEAAQAQGAELFGDVGRLLLALGDPNDVSPVTLHPSGRTGARALSIIADEVCARLPRLTPLSLEHVEKEAGAIPERWREPLRAELATGSHHGRRVAARLLEAIGDVSDVARLRKASRVVRGIDPSTGRHLARRLAPRVWVHDLGFMRVDVGSRSVDGGELRRKVLALLCLLLTKPAMRAPREEVLDVLWPEADPIAALNSLNQTVYFLRRVFEPDYEEDLSPGFLVQTAETIWLDAELVDSASRACWRLLRAGAASLSDAEVGELMRLYDGRFAMDFAYEDWATGFGEALHAAFLHAVETALRRILDSGDVSHGLGLAHQAARVEPDSEAVSESLVRLYRLGGAHSAAIEQYGHYARVLRELGVDPPRFEDV